MCCIFSCNSLVEVLLCIPRGAGSFGGVEVTGVDIVNSVGNATKIIGSRDMRDIGSKYESE